jgi:hypothetical protein
MKNPVKSIFRATTGRLEGMESILAIPKENCGVEERVEFSQSYEIAMQTFF